MPKKTEDLIELDFVVTETAANTYTNAEIDLPTTPAQGLVFNWDSVEFDITAPGQAANTLGNIQIQFHYNNEAAMLNSDDPDLIGHVEQQVSNASANAAFWTAIDLRQLDTQPGILEDKFLVVRNIFVAIQGTNQAAARAVRGKIKGRLQKVTANELTSLLLEQGQ